MLSAAAQLVQEKVEDLKAKKHSHDCMLPPIDKVITEEENMDHASFKA